MLSDFFCSDYIQLDDKYDVVSPNGYPKPYPNNVYSFWDIRAPSDSVIRVHIESFEVKGGADFVHIGDDVEHYSNDSTGDSRWKHLTGKKPDVYQSQDFESKKSAIIIIFVSDWSMRDYGFIIKCSAVKRPDHGETASTSEGISNLILFVSIPVMFY